MRFWAAVVTVLAWAALAATGTAAADVGSEPPVAFADADALSVSCAELTEGKVRVPIRNETALSQPQVSYELQLNDENGNPVDEASVCGGLQGGRGTAELAPGGTATIELGAAKDSDARKISGSFVLYAKGGRVARRDIEITGAQAARQLEATPLVGKVSKEAGPSDHGPIWVPIEGEPPHDAESGEGTKAITLGALVGPGDPIAVTYKGEAEAVSGDSSKVALDLEGDLEPGVYTGKVDLNLKDPEAGTVELEVKVSRSWVLAALTLLAGIIVGAGLLAASGRLIPSARLKGQVAALVDRCRDAEATLRQVDGGGKKWNQFGIEKVQDLQSPIYKKITEATGKVLIQIEKSAQESIESEIKSAAAQIDLLKEVPKHARDLEAALQLQLAVNLPEAKEERPQIERSATEVLEGKKVTSDVLKARLDEMDGKGKEVKRLRHLERVLEKCWINSQKLSGHGAKLGKLEDSLRACQDSLWAAGNTDELDEVDEDLHEARKELAEIRPPQPSDSSTFKAFAISAAVEGGDEIFEDLPSGAFDPQPEGLPEPREELLPPSPPPSTLPPPAEDIGDAISKAWWAQIVIVLVSAGLAVTGGLGVLYIGKTWGTCWDFIAAFTWGIGGQALVSTLANSLDGLTSLNWLRRS
jgi:hypothetical protein